MGSGSPAKAETRRFSVQGRVQRVGFRAATRRQAVRLGLQGFARNCDDGTVEVQVTGPPEAVAALRSWLDDGPTLARVDAVSELAPLSVEAAGFDVG